jgi:hypothetical protein
MKEADRLLRNETRLTEMHPSFRARVAPILKDLEGFGYRPRIQDAWRSLDRQLELYKQGFSKTTYGYHNVTGANARKEAFAADILSDDDPLGKPLDYILHLAAAAEKNECTTGIRWGLSEQKSAIIDKTIADKNWKAQVQVGWDPFHVQIAGISIEELRAGKRPPMPSEGGDNQPNEPTDGGEPTVTDENEDQPGAEGIYHYRVEKLETNEVKEYNLPTPLKPVSLLPIPFVSQMGPGADAHRNDCGAACAVMLLKAYLGKRMTPDEFYTKNGLQGDSLVSVAQIIDGMSRQGLLSESRPGLALANLFTYLAMGKPLIALLRYKTLKDAGLNFVVVIGIDSKYVYVNDPLFEDPIDGEARPYPFDLFWTAWKDIANDPKYPAVERLAIIPSSVIGPAHLRAVRVTASFLNIRSGPGSQYPTVGSLKKDAVVNILREYYGWGEIGDKRWIALAYTQIVE